MNVDVGKENFSAFVFFFKVEDGYISSKKHKIPTFDMMVILEFVAQCESPSEFHERLNKH